MKKSIISASPFIMLIIPVILFLGLSLAIEKETEQPEVVMKPAVQAGSLIKAGEASLIRMLLK